MPTRSEASSENPKKPLKNHLITRKRLTEFIESHPGARRDSAAFEMWVRIVKDASWKTFSHVRETFPGADLVGDLVVFNVGGNKYRVIAYIDYGRIDTLTHVYIKFVLTHAEYDEEKWKESRY